MKQKQRRTIAIVMASLLAAGCLLAGFTVLGSGVGLWWIFNSSAETVTPIPRLTRRAAAAPTFTPTASPTTLPPATPTPTVTPTLPSTATPSPTPTTLSPTPTPLPPTDTPAPAPLPPTATPPPTDTPAPSYPFIIQETAQYPTNHLNFDVYVAVTSGKNKPLPGYRLRGLHSSGLQIDSQVSADDWTQNSGAMHYKAGNIKYEVANSPTGVWTLQLLDEADMPVAPPVEFSFDAASPTWYFLLYRLAE